MSIKFLWVFIGNLLRANSSLDKPLIVNLFCQLKIPAATIRVVAATSYGTPAVTHESSGRGRRHP